MSIAKTIALLLGLVALAAFPVLSGNTYYIHLVGTILIYAILLFGLDVVVGYTGQVSLGHAGLFGIGAYTAGVLVLQMSAPVWLTLPAAIVVTALFGVALALPALRVTGPYLAMVTLAFGTIVQILINEMTFLTNGPMGIKLAKPALFGHTLDEREFFWFVALVLVVTLLVVHRVLKSHIGRAFEALRGSPVAADCMGVSVYRYKVYAFVFSAALAGLAGALYAYSEQYISPNTYNFEQTILFLLAIIMGGRKTRSGALVGATVVVMLPQLLDDIGLFRYTAAALAAVVIAGSAVALVRKTTTVPRVLVPIVGTMGLTVFAFSVDTIADWRLTIFGLMILFVVYYLQDGIVGYVRELVLHRVRRRAPSTTAPAAGRQEAVLSAGAGTSDFILDVRSVLMQFGGLKALNNVELRVRRGSIHGLIGPNGSGKSTMMNVLTGIYVPTAGSIAFEDASIVGRTSAQIALSGVARTFQNVQLFGEMTALENVLVGLNHTFGSTLFNVALHTPGWRREENAARDRARGLLDFVGLAGLEDEEARNLPYGRQRMLEIARALALDPRLLLLDEPAAGLTAPDIKDLIEIIRKIRDHGITVILIEHHMDVVMGSCDVVSVLDFGQKIAEGQPVQVQSDPKVIEAYLGGQAA